MDTFIPFQIDRESSARVGNIFADVYVKGEVHGCRFRI